ncbi:MAG: hydrogenase 3 maturation endopeptidase HyCI [candidate division WOR-3 bacterium]
MTIVILGVGNRLRGDDGIGSIVATELKEMLTKGLIKVINKEVFIYDTESSPENYLDKVIDKKADWVIFIDACDFKAQAGEFRLFDGDEINDIAYGFLSTHTLPLTLTIELIRKQTNSKISLLGVQPKSLTFGEVLSPEVSAVKSKIIDFLKQLIVN